MVQAGRSLVVTTKRAVMVVAVAVAHPIEAATARGGQRLSFGAAGETSAESRTARSRWNARSAPSSSGCE